MALAGDDVSTAARSRRERRTRADARLRLTLVKDGACLAGHRGGPERREDGSNVAMLRSEVEQLRAEIAVLKAELQSALEVQHQQVVQQAHVPELSSQEEVEHVPKVKQQASVQHQLAGKVDGVPDDEEETLQAADPPQESSLAAAHGASSQAEFRESASTCAGDGDMAAEAARNQRLAVEAEEPAKKAEEVRCHMKQLPVKKSREKLVSGVKRRVPKPKGWSSDSDSAWSDAE